MKPLFERIKTSITENFEPSGDTTTSHAPIISNVLGLLTCMSYTIGIGNTWGFTKMLATNVDSRGALVFYICWAITLFLWSIPILMVEYSIGRFTKSSIAISYCKFLNTKFFWLGLWCILVSTLISCHYPITISWSLYHFIRSWMSVLLQKYESDNERYKLLVENTYLLLVTHFFTIGLCGYCLLGGSKYIEKVNKMMAFLHPIVIILTFSLSITRKYAEVGIAFLFTPHWEDLKNPNIWMAAIAQNAFDTGSGMAIMCSYAVLLSRESRIVAYSYFIPIFNNLISLLSSFTLFSSIFAIVVLINPAATRTSIIRTISNSGPGGVGAFFQWLPLFFSEFGRYGALICSLYFLSFFISGMSTLIGLFNVPILILKEFSVPHYLAVILVASFSFICGLPSILNLNVFANQDITWNYGLVISGAVFSLIVNCYGPNRYRNVLMNNFSSNDCSVSAIWIFLISFLIPVQCVLLMAWWIYDVIANDSEWYTMKWDSLCLILSQWLILAVLAVIINVILHKTKLLELILKSKPDCDPHNPDTRADSENETEQQSEF